MTIRLPSIIISILLIISFSVLFANAAETPQATEGNGKLTEETDLPESENEHSDFKELQQEFESGSEVTKACLSCHQDIGNAMLKTHMWKWECPSYRKYKHGKSGFTLNNTGISPVSNEFSCYFCHISYRWEDSGLSLKSANNIDCLICHEQTNGKYIEYRKEWNPYLNKIAQNVGRPTKRNCGACHFYRSGGDGALRGDLSTRLLKADRDHDVHMDINGPNYDCVDCHITHNHKISERCYENAATISGSKSNQRYDCTSCHNDNLHQSIHKINDHIDRVACETCHIPMISRDQYSRVWSDFSKAGKLKDGKTITTRNQDGKKIYTSKKGEWQWAKNITPEYFWFNGGYTYTLVTDKIDPSRKVKLNYTNTDNNDPQAKIYPFKVHSAKQPYDKVNNTMVVPKFTDKNKDSGAYWIDYDWNKAIKAGMDDMGLPYGGEYGFVETAYMYAIHHTIVPKEKALKCAECHTRDSGRLEKLNGFYMPGRDRSLIIDYGGLLCILVAISGVLLHAFRGSMTGGKRGGQ